MTDRDQLPIKLSGKIYQLQYEQALQQASQFIHQARFDEAIALWQQLATQKPNRIESFQHLFRLLFQQARYENLLHWANYCLEHSPHHLLALKTKAKAHRFLQQHASAIKVLTQAQQSASEDAEMALQLGILQKELGNFSEALQQFKHCITLEPNQHQAYWQKADLDKGITEQQLKQLHQKALSYQFSLDERAHFAYAAARGYEHLRLDAECFSLYQLGATLKRQQLQYSHQDELAQLKKLKAFVPKEFPGHAASLNTGPVPIFICGLPRSGTTLTEQILSNHPRVEAGDELFELARATAQCIPAKWHHHSFAEWLPQASIALCESIGERYLQNTQRLHAKGYFTDKMPLNFKAIGLIQQALPQAKIIYCRRNSMDTLWGCYRQLFADGIAFSYNLDELTDILIATEQLMRHWQQQLPDKIITLDYEALLQSPEQQIRALLAHCDLPWDQACLDFHTNRRAVHTISNSQIRQPLNKSRLGQWQRFAMQLAPYHQKLAHALR